VDDEEAVEKEVVCGGIEIEIPRVRYVVRAPRFSGLLWCCTLLPQLAVTMLYPLSPHSTATMISEQQIDNETCAPHISGL
jgi:hypothetical protein